MTKILLTPIEADDLRLIVRQELNMALDRIHSAQSRTEKEILTVSEAAKLLDLAVPTIYGLVHRRLIPYYKQGRKLRFKRLELVTWLELGKRKTVQELASGSNSLLLRNPKSNEQ